MSNNERKILVTGATGYVGGRLARRLYEAGYPVRCMARNPSNLTGRLEEDIEVVYGDVTRRDSLDAALDGVDTAFYLVHALAASGNFEDTEVAGARNFAAAARAAGVRRLVYLGGLANEGEETSAHMRSRHAVGEILRESGVPTVEFRASIIIGAGSLSFELIRSLVKRLPVMIVPRWVRVKAQPIAIDDVLAYLEAAIALDVDESSVYEIGGEEALSYLGLMKRYGELTGLKRIYINVPFLTPWLSSLWLNLVTPIFARVGRKLIDSIRVASVVLDDRARRVFDISPIDVTEAIQRARDEEDRAFVATHWSDALSASTDGRPYGGQRFGSRIVDARMIQTDALPERAFAVVEAIGGRTGWYYGDWLWQLRGLLDRAIGGVGMQRGRRNPERLHTGDVVDCWRVEAIERPNRLLLRAEMKVFGRAWLQFEVTEREGRTAILQTAVYDPHGLTGMCYWYALYPLHEFVFRGMLRGIARAADVALKNDADARAVKVVANPQSLPPYT